MNDKRTVLHQHRQQLAFFHALNFRMRKIPVLIETVNQEIRAAVGHFHAGKNIKSDFFAVCRALFIIGEVELDAFRIRQGAVNIDVAIDEMIGDKDTGISDFLVVAHGFLRCCSGTAADGCGVKMGFVIIH